MPVRTRRAFLSGARPEFQHISSAVVIALPAHRDAVVQSLAVMPGVEVHATEGSRIVVTIEGPTSGFLGEALVSISLMEGVISANMVFEQALAPEVNAT